MWWVYRDFCLDCGWFTKQMGWRVCPVCGNEKPECEFEFINHHMKWSLWGKYYTRITFKNWKIVRTIWYRHKERILNKKLLKEIKRNRKYEVL